VASIEINGGLVEYELLGPQDGAALVLTPGGRFSKTLAGSRRLADTLAEGGLRVLVWDRPNCGLSDVQFYGPTESHMRAETLGNLIKALDLGPIVIAGGSGGARDSALTAALYPELTRKLFLWQPVGGVYATMNMAYVYVLPSIMAVRRGGIEMVMEMPEWATLIEANPRNKDRMLELGTDGFRETMFRWLNAWVPQANRVIPGVDDWLLQSIQVPTTIMRSGVGDLDHPTRTSYDVHSLIKGSQFIEPPWEEDAWEKSSAKSFRGEGDSLQHWYRGAPTIIEFANS
jgi:2-hydroxy-6-oxonona-2,4-dienedioate hydrolase